MKKQTIQQPESYEAPRVKVKELRKRSVIAASLTLGAETENEDGVDTGSN